MRSFSIRYGMPLAGLAKTSCVLAHEAALLARLRTAATAEHDTDPQLIGRPRGLLQFRRESMTRTPGSNCHYAPSAGTHCIHHTSREPRRWCDVRICTTNFMDPQAHIASRDSRVLSSHVEPCHQIHPLLCDVTSSIGIALADRAA
jgi:hypothetical protein